MFCAYFETVYITFCQHTFSAKFKMVYKNSNKLLYVS